MYTLCINDSTGRTQGWWINFLVSLPSDVKDVAKELKSWKASITYNTYGYGDTIVFDREEDLFWFLLRWV
jgi:hypothetical protein